MAMWISNPGLIVSIVYKSLCWYHFHAGLSTSKKWMLIQ